MGTTAMNVILEGIVIHYKAIVLSFAVVSLLIAFLFLMGSNVLLRMNNAMKKTISTASSFEEMMNKNRDADDKIMAFRKLLGIVCIIATGLFIFMYLR